MMLNGYELEATTLKQLIRARAGLGDKAFAIVDDQTLTYADADREANQIANSLSARGLGKGDVLATYMHNSVEHILVWFACAKLGAIWAPLNISLARADLAYTVNDTAARIVIVDEELRANYLAARDDIALPDLVEVVHADTGAAPPPGWLALAELRQGSTVEPDVEVDWNDPAGLIYTGGTTGRPKGVLVANMWYFPGVLRYYEMFRPTTEDAHLGLGQMCHTIGSAVDLIAPMYWQLTTVTSRWFSASRLFDTARKHHATVSVIVGPAVAALLSQPERDDDVDNPLRIIGTGTGSAPRALVEPFRERFAVDILELYGQTETGPLGCVSQRVDDRPYHSLGTANGWAEIAVLTVKDEPCAIDEVGEIALRPIHPFTFMLGYHRNPDQTARAWRGLWFHSGDLGRLDARGYLHFAGRLAHVISWRGEKISAFEIEELLAQHPAVYDCAVVGVPAEFGDEHIKAYIQLRDGYTAPEADFVRFCDDRIAYFKVPRFVELVGELPRSVAKGEIERFRLRERGIGDAWDRESAGYQLRRRST